MGLKYGFFNSVNHDRLYNADDMTNYFKGLISDGVYETIGSKFNVISGTGLSIKIGTGRALINTHWLNNDETINITLSPSDTINSRYDTIVIVYNETSRIINIEVIQGEVGHGATYPINTENEKYLILATVLIRANSTQIMQYDITDLRGTNRCPWVTGIIQQVDTNDLFLQWQSACENFYNSMSSEMTRYFIEKKAEFDEWLENIQQTLEINTNIIKYENSYTVGEESAHNLPIGIIQYDKDKDILLVFVNGVKLVDTIDYSITDNTKINVNNAVQRNNRVEFIVLKSKIGES